MAIVCTPSNHYKFQLASKLIDLLNDSIIVSLMRDGFAFSKDDHAMKKNFKASSGPISITFAATGKTITRVGGSFITDGFIIGNQITSDASLNPGPFTIANVAELVITVNETVADEGPVTKTVTADDELSSGNGYTPYTKALTSQALAENDTTDKAEMTCGDVTWAATDSGIGPTPGALLIDDSTSDKTIIGYLDFGGDQTAAAGYNLVLEDIMVFVS